jgi:hypothetical protein
MDNEAKDAQPSCGHDNSRSTSNQATSIRSSQCAKAPSRRVKSQDVVHSTTCLPAEIYRRELSGVFHCKKERNNDVQVCNAQLKVISF